MYSKLDNFWKLFFCNFGKMGKILDFDILQPIWSIRYSEPFSTCFQTKFHFRNIEFVNNLVRYDFGSVISVSVIFFRFSVFRYFGKNTVSVEHYSLLLSAKSVITTLALRLQWLSHFNIKVAVAVPTENEGGILR